MFKSISLENFKAYKSLESARLAPLTLIYGKNSSGKSAIAQSVMQAKYPGPLIFKTPTYDIGNYDQILFGQGSNKESIGIKFQAKISNLLGRRRTRVANITKAGSYGYADFFWQTGGDVEIERKYDKEGVSEITLVVNARPFFSKHDQVRFSTLAEFFEQCDSPFESLQRIEVRLKRKPGYPLASGRPGRGFVRLSLARNELINNLDESSYEKMAKLFDGEFFDVRNLDKAIKEIDREYDFSDDEDEEGEDESFVASTPWGHLGAALIHLFNELYSANFRRGFEHIPAFRGIPERIMVKTGQSLGQSSFANYFWHQAFAQLSNGKRGVVTDISKYLDQWGIDYTLSAKAESFSGADIENIKLTESLENGDIDLSLLDVGFGISQLLPILVLGLTPGNADLFVVEEPEVHLHPKLQADLADFFVDRAKLGRSQWILETHSENLLLRIQKHIRNGDLDPKDVSILYAQHEKSGSTVQELRLDRNGSFIDDWPEGFFEERMIELLDD